jgi:hypothetical protein
MIVKVLVFRVCVPLVFLFLVNTQTYSARLENLHGNHPLKQWRIAETPASFVHVHRSIQAKHPSRHLKFEEWKNLLLQTLSCCFVKLLSINTVRLQNHFSAVVEREWQKYPMDLVNKSVNSLEALTFCWTGVHQIDCTTSSYPKREYHFLVIFESLSRRTHRTIGAYA